MLTPEQAESVREQILEQIEKLPEEQRGNLKEQVENASPDELESFIKQQPSSGECLFCGIGKGSVETIKIYEDSGIVAFLDINPAIPGQVIIIPKEHYQFIFQIPDQILWDITRMIKTLMPIIVNITKCAGVSIYIAQGPAAGQRIAHAAVNLIPRFENDKAVFAWDRKEFPKEEIQRAAREIKISLEKTFADEKAKLIAKIEAEEKASPKPLSKDYPKNEFLPEAPRQRA